MKSVKRTRIVEIALLLMAMSISLACPYRAEAAASRPVICVGSLMGVFAEGEWQNAPGVVTVDGQPVDLENIEKDKVFAKLESAEDGLDCVNSLIVAGQKIAYYGPDGIKKHEGAVTRTSIWYEGEASGAAALNVEVQGSDEIDWSQLVVGVSAEVVAAPVPTIRTNEDGGVRFSCEYEGEKYAVSWASGDGGARLITLSGGGASWKLEDEGINPEDLEELQCGFFDLNGDGSLELVVYNSGINGSVALFRFAPNAEPERFAWKYTGEE
ncbi:hypothetical protein LJB81_02330 [Desulfovibrio sp. OttesenSCG-928-M14]|nr:hypothetical protein [Desulfovibrio sp. OttesenSCG-928-M14]